VVLAGVGGLDAAPGPQEHQQDHRDVPAGPDALNDGGLELATIYSVV
jgi:hypothetical protein